MKERSKIKNPYSLRIRVKKEDGKYGKWSGYGKGEFFDIKIVQRQMIMLSSSNKKGHSEIEFIKNGVLLDYNGKETQNYIVL